jgi:predicted DNA-binding transcriptional regulator YafY
MRYQRDGSDAVERTLDPLGLVLKAGTWYVLARGDSAVRTYRVSRILDVRETGERFERPPDFDLAAAWHDSRAAFEAGLPRVEVTVCATAEAVPELRSLFDERTRAAIDWEGEPHGASDDGGRVRLVLPFERLEYAHRGLLGLGPTVEVLAPAELRERMAASARALAVTYSDRQPADD